MNISFSTKQKKFLCEIAGKSEWGNAPFPLKSVDESMLMSIISRYKSKVELTNNRDIVSFSSDNKKERVDLKLVSSVQWAVLRIIRSDDNIEYISVLWLPHGACGSPYFPE